MEYIIITKEELIKNIMNKIDYKYIESIRKDIKEEINKGLQNRDIRILVQEEVKAQLKVIK